MTIYLKGLCDTGDCCEDCECAKTCKCDGSEYCIKQIIPSVTPWNSFTEYSYYTAEVYRGTGIYETVMVEECEWVEWYDEFNRYNSERVCKDVPREREIFAYVEMVYETRYSHTAYEISYLDSECYTNKGNVTSFLPNPDAVTYPAMTHWMTTQKNSMSTLNNTWRNEDGESLASEYQEHYDLEENTITTVHQTNEQPIDLGHGSWVYMDVDENGNIVEEGISVGGVFMRGFVGANGSIDSNCQYYNNLSPICIREGYAPHRCAGWSGGGYTVDECG